MSCSCLFLLAIACTTAEARADDVPLTVTTSEFSARFSTGSMCSLTGADGTVFVRSPQESQGVGAYHVDEEHFATSAEGPGSLQGRQSAVRRYRDFSDDAETEVSNSFRVDSESGDLVIGQECTSHKPGLWGVSWSINEIPLEYSIIVPGQSGIRLTKDAPGRRHQFDYPMGWEAQMVIVEGPDRGFYVWADDARGRFKRLVVGRDDHGWRLTFVTVNQAPFDGLTDCHSVDWHLNTYRGDWRVPAGRYRDWADANLRPTPVAEQDPAWVKDIRCVVIMGMNEEILTALPERLDPEQTIIYLPSWRAAGYDRDYPSYDRPYEQLEGFVERAHQLGFRIMLHVNYFGVDPLNPVYERFEPFQVRSEWGEHEKQWWLWARAEPEIRFAYINPALKAWRDYFTDAMVELCRDYRIDSLHLDQTLVIFNDHNGPIDGMTMAEGNLALHRQLREALPDVALSGEGLNEITYRHEAFAQRHAWGLNHADGTWDRRWLELAHPICSYLFRRYTVINGYLGCASPIAGQIYPAWNEAYEHWGVIPTLKPSLDQVKQPTGFSRQFFDEVSFWQESRLDIEMESEWPAGVAFPFRTADGQRTVRTVDGRFLCGEKQISRTVSGLNRLETAGTVPGWKAYDGKRLLGLDPEHWYPCFDDPRDLDALHVSELPDGVILQGLSSSAEMAIVRTTSRSRVVADLVDLLNGATVGSRSFDGQIDAEIGPRMAANGAQFQSASGNTLAAHPPWKGSQLGIAFARYTVDLPKKDQLRLVADVCIDVQATKQDRSDGVLFGISATSGNQRLEAEVHNDSDEPKTLELDLTPFAGRRVDVELTVHPGENLAVSYDWARWKRPRIDHNVMGQEPLAVTGAKPWEVAIGRDGPLAVETRGTTRRVVAPLPGTVFFLNEQPAAVELPVDLVSCQREVCYTGDSDAGARPDFVGVSAAESTVDGVTRGGLFAHPPHHGCTVINFPIKLPAGGGRFDSFVGIRDGATSTGVVFSVEVNGQAVVNRKMLPGVWETLSADLSQWAGKPIVFSLITDSDGPHTCDWAQWGEPTIRPK